MIDESLFRPSAEALVVSFVQRVKDIHPKVPFRYCNWLHWKMNVLFIQLLNLEKGESKEVVTIIEKLSSCKKLSSYKAMLLLQEQEPLL